MYIILDFFFKLKKLKFLFLDLFQHLKKIKNKLNKI